MRWEDNRESDNVEDRRAEGGGGGGGMRFGGIHLGLGGIIVVVLGSWLFGINPLTVLGFLSGTDTTQTSSPATDQTADDQAAAAPPANDPLANFVRTVLAST